MTRDRYFAWTRAATESLKTLREAGHKWPVIAGRLSAMYDMAVTANACRSKYDRSLKWKDSPIKSKGDLDLSPIFRNAPPAVREQIVRDEIKDYDFSRLYYVTYDPTDEQVEAAIREHWGYFVEYQAEIHDISDEEIQAAKDHDPPRWFRNWVIGISMWHPCR